MRFAGRLAAWLAALLLYPGRPQTLRSARKPLRSPARFSWQKPQRALRSNLFAGDMPSRIQPAKLRILSLGLPISLPLPLLPFSGEGAHLAGQVARCARGARGVGDRSPRSWTSWFMEIPLAK